MECQSSLLGEPHLSAKESYLGKSVDLLPSSEESDAGSAGACGSICSGVGEDRGQGAGTGPAETVWADLAGCGGVGCGSLGGVTGLWKTSSSVLANPPCAVSACSRAQEVTLVSG